MSIVRWIGKDDHREPSGTIRLRLTPDEIIDRLPDALIPNAIGSYRPAVAWDVADMNHTFGPRVDESGELGQIWRTAYRGMTVTVAIDPDGLNTAWALRDEDDTLDTGTIEGRMSIGEMLDIIDDEHERREIAKGES